MVIKQVMKMLHKLNKLKGTIIIKNLDTNEIIHSENVVTNVGWRHLFYLAGGSSSKYFKYLAIGDGDTDASEDDTSLENEREDRIESENVSYTENYFEITWTILDNQHLYNWKELGVFTESEDGTMFARTNVDYNHSENQVQVIWRWERE